MVTERLSYVFNAKELELEAGAVRAGRTVARAPEVVSVNTPKNEDTYLFVPFHEANAEAPHVSPANGTSGYEF